MENKNNNKKVDMSDFKTRYLSLRIGEEIPHLKVKEIKKIINAESENNLSGVDYKYIIVSESDEILTINSWVFYNSLKRAIQNHKEFPKILSLKHIAEKVYEITVVE